jgi:hypothetical protein
MWRTGRIIDLPKTAVHSTQAEYFGPSVADRRSLGDKELDVLQG